MLWRTLGTHLGSEARGELRRYVQGDPASRALQQREWFFKIARRFTPIVAVDSDLGRLNVSTNDRIIGMQTFLEGGYDRDAIDSVLTDLATHRPGWHDTDGLIVEVGANIGTTSLILAQYGPVLAFEPIPENVALLRQNVVANGMQHRVTIRAMALSDAAGTVSMELHASNSGDHRVRMTTAEGLHGEHDRATATVRSARLDDEVEGQRVSLVWMDAQGHEGFVLAGAPEVLRSGPPMVVEYWPYGLQRAGGLELLERLIAENYTTVVDSSRRGRDHAEAFPAGSLPKLRARYPTIGDYTDLVLLR
jgi:FkbM family methyltransferase